jgi:DNA repair exonuclease SbcCD ATPase subunit
MSKLYLISKLSDNDRAELTKNTDLENTSVRELEQKIKQLTSEKETAAAQISSLTQTADGLKNQISELEKEIEELESRPIEVAVADDSREVANLKDAMKRVDLEWGQRYGELEEQSIKDRREAEQEKQAALAKLRAELERTKAEYEKQLAEKTAEPDSKETFKAYLAAAIDSATRLCDFVHAHSEDVNFGFFCEKSKALSDMINKKLEEC